MSATIISASGKRVPKQLMPKRALAAKSPRGHAETPYIVGCGSLVSGLVWATLLVVKHKEYALGLKVFLFLISPLVGLLFVIAFIAVVLVFGSAGDWLDKQIATRRRSREN